MRSDRESGQLFTPGRIETLTDGIFAIVMTLLVLEISTPMVAEPVAEAELWQALLDRIPNFMGYGVSFVILGMFWVVHHRQFRFVERADRVFVWMSILTLLFVALIPFSTGLLSRYPGSQTALFVYAGNLLVASAWAAGQWWYASLGHRLISRDLDPQILREIRQRSFIAPAGLVIIMGVSYVHVTLSLIGLAVLAVFFISSPMFERRYGRLVRPPGSS